MSLSADQLAVEALALPLVERERLTAVLISSLDDAVDGDPAEIEMAWSAEIERRDRELDANPSLGRPAVEVFAEANRRLREIRGERDGRG